MRSMRCAPASREKPVKSLDRTDDLWDRATPQVVLNPQCLLVRLGPMAEDVDHRQEKPFRLLHGHHHVSADSFPETRSIDPGQIKLELISGSIFDTAPESLAQGKLRFRSHPSIS